MVATAGNDEITGSTGPDIIDPLGGDDTVWGSHGNDRIWASAGDDVFYGGAGDPGGFWPGANPPPNPDIGLDTLFFQSARSDVVLQSAVFRGAWGNIYGFPQDVPGLQTTSPLDGHDRFIQVERLVFAGGEALALDIRYDWYDYVAGNAGVAAKLVTALFGAEALSNEVAVGIALALVDRGSEQEDIAALALEYLGIDDDETFVQLIWDNVVGLPMIDSYRQAFLLELANGMSREQFAVLAANSVYTSSQIDHEYLAQHGLAYQQHVAYAGVPRVVAVTHASALEGEELVHNVTLSATTSHPTSFYIALTGRTATPADWGIVSATEGVTVVGNLVFVEQAIDGFQLLIPAVDDEIDEDTETFGVKIGGITVQAEILDDDGPSAILEWGDAWTIEGGTLVFEVVMTFAASVETRFDFELLGVEGDADPDSLAFTHGVMVDDGELVVPAGVADFSMSITTIYDAWYDRAGYVRVSIDGGVIGFSSIDEVGPQPPNEEHLFDEQYRLIGGFAAFTSDDDGPLSVTSLREAVIAQTGEEDYWLLFDPALVEGPDDGVWTWLELGGGPLGYYHPSAETLEDLIYGTHAFMARRVTAEEQQAMTDYVAEFASELDAGDNEVSSGYVSLVYESLYVSYMYDPNAPAGVTDEDLAAGMVGFFVELVGIVEAGGEVGVLEMLPLGWNG
ncbi:MAG TPA: hypothetical protein VK996_16640 [Ramlibacter sp.]|nr:hypothetical protein [Ramlibacter sp.]